MSIYLDPLGNIIDASTLVLDGLTDGIADVIGGVLGTATLDPTLNYSSGTLTVNPNLSLTSLSTSILTVTGTTNVAGLTTTANIIPSGGPNLGSSLSRFTDGYFAGVLNCGSLNGTLLTASQPNITSVGSLTGLTVNGSVSIKGNILQNFTSGTYFIGSSSAAWARLYSNTISSDSTVTQIGVQLGAGTDIYTINAAGIKPTVDITNSLGDATHRYLNIYGGTITGTTLTGTLSTASQPNVTSLGTLTSLAVSGAVTLTGTVTLTGSIVPSVDNTYFLGDATHRYLTIYANSINASGLTGTLQTAAQTNVTSLGTLTSLTMSGTISSLIIRPSTTNTYTLGDATHLYSTVYATSYNGTIVTASQPNITTVGTLTSLTMNGTINSISMYPQLTNAYNVGSATFRYKDIYSVNLNCDSCNVNGTTTTLSVSAGNISASGTLSVTGTSTLGAVTVTGNIIPSATNTYNLGDSTHAFADCNISNLKCNTNPMTISVTGTSNLLLYTDTLRSVGNGTIHLGDPSHVFIDIYANNFTSGGSLNIIPNNYATTGQIYMYGNVNFSNLTTVQKNALTLSQGAVVFDTDLNRLSMYDGNITNYLSIQMQVQSIRAAGNTTFTTTTTGIDVSGMSLTFKAPKSGIVRVYLRGGMYYINGVMGNSTYVGLSTTSGSQAYTGWDWGMFVYTGPGTPLIDQRPLDNMIYKSGLTAGTTYTIYLKLGSAAVATSCNLTSGGGLGNTGLIELAVEFV